MVGVVGVVGFGYGILVRGYPFNSDSATDAGGLRTRSPCVHSTATEHTAEKGPPAASELQVGGGGASPRHRPAYIGVTYVRYEPRA